VGDRGQEITRHGSRANRIIIAHAPLSGTWDDLGITVAAHDVTAAALPGSSEGTTRTAIGSPDHSVTNVTLSRKPLDEQ